MLSEKEVQVLSLLKKNPYASQQEMAEILGLSRPSIANLISGLIKLGKIKGRAYVLSEENPVLVFGGMNLDRKMIVKGQLAYQTSNPVTSYQTVGGVARNIAENLGRLGHDVKLMSAAGHDMEWEFIYDKTSEWVDLQHVKRLEEERTGTYTAVLDTTGEMQVAFADMEIYQRLTPEWVTNHEKLFRSAKLIIIDLNLEQTTVQMILDYAKSYQVPVAIVPVSAPKMRNLPSNLEGVTWLICNQGEAEVIANIKISTNADLKRAHVILKNKGIVHSVITNGAQGITYREDEEVIHVNAFNPSEIMDVTGAGDSFVAATMHMWLDTGEVKEALIAGLWNATKTLESPFTVRTDLTKESLQNQLEEL